MAAWTCTLLLIKCRIIPGIATSVQFCQTVPAIPAKYIAVPISTIWFVPRNCWPRCCCSFTIYTTCCKSCNPSNESTKQKRNERHFWNTSRRSAKTPQVPQASHDTFPNAFSLVVSLTQKRHKSRSRLCARGGRLSKPPEMRKANS